MADKEFAQWAKPSAQRLELVAQLEAMELAAASNKRSAFAGCEDTTVASWVKVLRAAKLPKVPSKYPLHDYLRAGLSTAEGYLAYSALRLCSEASESKATRPRSDAAATGLPCRRLLTPIHRSPTLPKKLEMPVRPGSGTAAS